MLSTPIIISLYSFQSQIVTGMSNLEIFCDIIANVLFTLYIMLPTAIFYIFYTDICEGLIHWIEDIIYHGDKSKCLNSALELYHNGIEPARNAFSCILFSIMVTVLFNLLGGSFMSLSFIFTYYWNHNFTENLKSLAMFVIIMQIFITAYHLNYLSQKVTEKVQTLKETIIFNIENATLDQRGIKIEKFYVVQKLGSFKGFDCCEFFILGKPFLTSVAANLVTYLIVLIQFKIFDLDTSLENNQTIISNLTKH